MMDATRARTILGASLLLGVVADLIIVLDRARLGFTLWILLAIGVAAWSARLLPAMPATGSVADSERVADPTRARDRRWILTVAGLAAIVFVMRDAEMLYALAFLLALASAAFVVWRAQGRPVTGARVADVPIAGVGAGLAALFGPTPLLVQDGALASHTPQQRRTLSQVALGSIAAVPVVAVLSALLGEADPMFEALRTAVFEFLATDFMRHLLMTGFITWVAAGWLRGGLVPNETVRILSRVEAPRLGFAFVAPALVATTLLLGAFLGIQARALFGGAAFVEATAGLSYAEYARRGFFELVVVGMLVLGLLLAADAVRTKDDAGSERRFRAVAWILLALVGVMCLSALHRLSLYIGYFGLTTQRFYAAALVVWLVLTLAWFGRTVLRGRPGTFGVGVLMTSAAWVLALQLVNPEAIVARTNIARAANGAEFDVAYHARLSADASPALLRGAASLDPTACAGLIVKMYDRTQASRELDADWRSWSLPVARRAAALSQAPVDLVWRYCRR